MKKLNLRRHLAVLAAAALLSVSAAVTALAATTRLDKVEDAYWDDDDPAIARWEEVEDASQYEVYLYCDDSKVKEIKTKKTKYNFSKAMTKEGEYTFRVRAVSSSKKYSNGSWSDYSDGTYIDADYAELMKNGGKIDTENSGPGAKEGGETTQTGALSQGQWLQDDAGWWYRRADGSYPKNEWFQDPNGGHWYFFNEQGYMFTGWLDRDGARYYLDANGTPSGAMVTGDKTIDGVDYHFDESGAQQ